MGREEAVAGSWSAREMLRNEAGGGTKVAWVELAGPETRLAFLRVQKAPFLVGEMRTWPVKEEEEDPRGSNSSVDLPRPSRFPPAKRAAPTVSPCCRNSSCAAAQGLW